MAFVVLSLAGDTARQANALGNVIVVNDSNDALGLDSDMALDSIGNPTVSYSQFGAFDLRVLHCFDQWCASRISVSPDSDGSVGDFSSIVLNSSGNPVVAYTDTSAGTLNVLRCGSASCDSPANTITTVGANGSYNDIVLDGAGNPVVSYTSSEGYLKVLHCGNQTCTAGNTTSTPDTNSSGISNTSMTLDGGGNPVMSYMDEDLFAPQLWVLHCGNAECSSGNSRVAVDFAGGYSSIVLDGIGNPVVSYYAIASRDLKVLHCGNPNCTSGNSITSPDTQGFVGAYTSMKLDTSGYPVVSYYDATNGDLKVLHCGDANCFAANSAVVADSTGDVGLYTSLGLDSSGNPVVSYIDGPNRDLRFLHCGNPNCDSDSDNDHCPDTSEQQTAVGSQTSGGLRNPKYPWDYFNPSHDGQNRTDDVLMVVNQYFHDDNDSNPGLAPYAPGYNPDTDRTLVGPNDWNSGPPNGLQRIDDILNIQKQYFHDCGPV